jgi:hypothetical protein
VAEQKAGCEHHRYSTTWIPAEQVDAAEDGSWISYKFQDGRIWRDEGDIDTVSS